MRVSKKEADELAESYETMACKPYDEDVFGFAVHGTRRLDTRTEREGAAFDLGRATGYAHGMLDALRILGVAHMAVPKDPGDFGSCYEDSTLWVGVAPEVGESASPHGPGWPTR